MKEETFLTSKVPRRERLGIVAGAELLRRERRGRWSEDENVYTVSTSITVCIRHACAYHSLYIDGRRSPTCNSRRDAENELSCMHMLQPLLRIRITGIFHHQKQTLTCACV